MIIPVFVLNWIKYTPDDICCPKVSWPSHIIENCPIWSISFIKDEISRKVIIAKDLREDFLKENKIEGSKVNFSFKGAELLNTKCQHPLFNSGYDFEVPVLHGDFVTTEQGTGIVHICPVHGMDDFILGKKNNLGRHL